MIFRVSNEAVEWQSSWWSKLRDIHGYPVHVLITIAIIVIFIYWFWFLQHVSFPADSDHSCFEHIPVVYKTIENYFSL